MASLREFIASTLREDADPSMIDRRLFPPRMGDVDAELARDLASLGLDDGADEADDMVDASPVTVPANELRASQTTMDFDKFIGMAIMMMCRTGGFDGPGGDLSAIVSSDGFIMDGHHRWAATLMVDPNASLSGIQISLPGEVLLGVLNVWSIAHGGRGKGSTARMSSLTSDAVAERFAELCASGGKHLPSPDEIELRLAENGYGSVDDAAELVRVNWALTAGLRHLESWMPPKIDMPAIEPNQLSKVVHDVTSGHVDMNPPYSQTVTDRM